MSTDHKYFMVVIFFVVLFFVSTSISYISYRRNLSKYKFFLDNYKRSSLFINSITKLSENLGFVFFYFKIVFFIRLLKNKKMYATKGVLVDQACYEYMLSFNPSEIKWMWEWRRNYLIQSAFLAMALLSAYIHSVVFNYQ
ncbi:hypothetical protein [Erwinia billingiae]|uniref:hypothetical protein n=1 Tax=Erwinia billingiae TaxID=182337 RepID=UPI000D088855|nr:hypothetical protein [Erwinia billingiae]PRB57074.1 hypothetical protein CQ001_18905 [Erwinia billingiae]